VVRGTGDTRVQLATRQEACHNYCMKTGNFSL
jgi:hypothetical protein